MDGGAGDPDRRDRATRGAGFVAARGREAAARGEGIGAQLTAALEQVGAQLTSNASYETLIINCHAPATGRATCLDSVAGMAIAPSFPAGANLPDDFIPFATENRFNFAPFNLLAGSRWLNPLQSHLFFGAILLLVLLVRYANQGARGADTTAATSAALVAGSVCGRRRRPTCPRWPAWPP